MFVFLVKILSARYLFKINNCINLTHFFALPIAYWGMLVGEVVTKHITVFYLGWRGSKTINEYNFYSSMEEKIKKVSGFWGFLV